MRFFEKKELENKRFIDVGCGSGIITLAALRLGCKKVLSIDIDPLCVKTTKILVNQYWSGSNWKCFEKSVFDLDKKEIGDFDIVYSWGVLHHTGAMHKAIENVAALVCPRGYLILGLYQKTMLCSIWRAEKKFYSQSSPFVQSVIQGIYLQLQFFYLRLIKINIKNKIINYKSNRGMDFFHDLHDWLGGYPYESINSDELIKFCSNIDFDIVKINLSRNRLGIFGSGINEYLLKNIK